MFTVSSRDGGGALSFGVPVYSSDKIGGKANHLSAGGRLSAVLVTQLGSEEALESSGHVVESN